VQVSGVRRVGIGVKAPGGKQNYKQIEFQRQLEKAGGLYVLAKSLDEVTAATYDWSVNPQILLLLKMLLTPFHRAHRFPTIRLPLGAPLSRES
jgi:hypothetical protein